MHKLVEKHLTRAITDRFNVGLKGTERCNRARRKVIEESLVEYNKHAGYGVSRDTLAWALESIAVELEAVWGQAIDRAEKAETRLEQMHLGCKETSDRLVQTQLENVRLKSEVTQTAARLHAEEQSAMESGGILSSVCDLAFDDPRRALDHGYDGVEDKIVEIINKLKLHQIQVSKYCADICTEGKAVQDLCKACPLGKLRG